MPRWQSAALLALTLLASAAHFLDNAFRLDLYHGPAWLTRNGVLFAWIVLFALACLVQYIGTRFALVAYACLGFAGFLHYLEPHPLDMPLRCTATIAAEALASLLLIVVTVARRQDGAAVTERPWVG